MKKKMSSVNVDAVILDLDGVITRTARVHAKAWKQMFDEYLEHRKQREESVFEPFDINKDYPRYIDGKPRYDGVRSFLQSHQIQLPEGYTDDKPGWDSICALGNRKNDIFLELIEKQGVEIFEDSMEKVRQWRAAGLKIAVVSSSKNCKAILKSANLTHLFEVQVDGVVAERLNLKGKPAPDIFLHAAKQLGVEPSRAVVIEDALVGVQAGSAGNFALVVGVDRRNQTEQLRKSGADIIVQTLAELQIFSHNNNPSAKQQLPSALKNQNEIKQQLTNKQTVLFLDYDGTLTPIVKNPDMAVLSDEMRSVLQQLASLTTVAIISGRDREDVKKLVGLEELIYAGSHGFDISGPADMRLQHQGGKDCLPELDQAETELQQQLDNIKGALVERKRFAIAVHYRNVSEKDVSSLKKIVEKTGQKYPQLQKGSGKKVIELQPAIDWHKGKAVLWLLKELRLNNSDVIPLYFGDDITDENAFQAISQRGIGILVGSHGETTAAKYDLKDVNEVQAFLNELIEFIKSGN
ncbi:MAG TPA: trehalose-phosphatase [bacterium]|nr:trehalose-phosphatase [bacterium]